jgi:hypothetical protein
MNVFRGVDVGEVGGVSRWIFFRRHEVMTKKGIHINLAGDQELVITSFAA